MFAAFGMKRATLLLSREAEVSSQVTAMLLPAWYPAVWLPRVAKWALLLYVALSWSWWVAIVLAILDLVLYCIQRVRPPKCSRRANHKP